MWNGKYKFNDPKSRTVVNDFFAPSIFDITGFKFFVIPLR